MVHGNQLAVHVITDFGAIIFDGPNMPIVRQPSGTVADTVFQAMHEYARAPFFARRAIIAADAGCREGIIRHGGEPFQNQQRTIRRTTAARGFAGADAVFVFMFVQPKRSAHTAQPVPIHFGADFGTERAACIHHADGFQPAAGILGDFSRRTYARGGVAVVQGVSFFINAVAARGQLGIIAGHERDVVRQVGQITVQMIADFFAFPIGRHAPFLEFIAFLASPLTGFIGRMFAAVFGRCGRGSRCGCWRWGRRR
ncbi:hypothetical protein GCWU000324_01856 [Kingella oralis ATCC 51147]|uniref:Uncharacterized protein n=1 Tax=Kingella oralis ATCC 51147 TaxID=629741 RepID=C4GII6_9NEIS|nr:hypothetical protein GCWU000324_01856 [Kingella oralis ATCC 51147]